MYVRTSLFPYPYSTRLGRLNMLFSPFLSVPIYFVLTSFLNIIIHIHRWTQKNIEAFVALENNPTQSVLRSAELINWTANEFG